MSLIILNDLHIGVQRAAGTTPLTQWNLRQYVLNEFERLMISITSGDLMILGDLFDTNAIPLYDLLRTYNIFQDTLSIESKIYLVAGNHDLSKTSNVMSSFDMLAGLLSDHPNFHVIKEPTMTPHGYVIPHLPNQELFNAALATVPQCEFLFLHCNYDNKFAAQYDQSLNISNEQAESCLAEQIIIAHEHQTKREGKVWLPGNQIASSVSDWLGTDRKIMTTIDGRTVGAITTQDKESNYVEMDWHGLVPTEAKFVRITGMASVSDASEALTAISRYRASSNALVVTNAVKVEGEDSTEEFAQTLQSVKAFDVLAALKEILEPEEWAVIEGLE